MNRKKLKPQSTPTLNLASKTILRPRTVEPRWQSVSEYGTVFHGRLALGNGTEFNVFCGFTFNRHFFFGIDEDMCKIFPAGKMTNPDEIESLYNFGTATDCKNLSDFINSQLDGGMETNEYKGEYIRQHCS